MYQSPYFFDEFFASGKEESISPFLTPKTRRLSKNLSLKSALLSAFFLLLSFVFSFYDRNLSNLFLVLVYFLVGTPALINSLEDLKRLEINIDVLMTLAALLSVLIDSAKEGGLLLVLFELSGAMEHTVIKKTKNALFSLHHITPKKATVIKEDGTLIERALPEIAIGTSILIKAGEIIPLDGIVIDGASYVNLVHLTGESTPVPKKKGDMVASGARNLDGTLTVSVNRHSQDSTLSRIIQLITQAQETKPRLETFLDRFGKGYAMCIISLSFLFALLLPHLFSIGYRGPEGSIYRALTFLITASPCALIIATPTAYLSAISSCAKKGILLKGGTMLDAIFSCKKVAFDKTGTLTSGELEMVDVMPILDKDGIHKEEAIQVAATLEKSSTHPIAKAILAKAGEKNLSFLPIDGFKQESGYGLSATLTIQGKKLLCGIGHKDFVDRILDKEALKEWEEKKASLAPSYTACFLILGKSLFVFLFKDSIRKEAKIAIDFLHQAQIDVCMLTGDHQQSAEIVANELGIDSYFADLKPDQKLSIIEKLALKEEIAMIGDGINDAPALARATVGISMGKVGSGTAIDASDVVFLQDDLSLIPFLFHKAKKTTRLIKENLFLSLGVILLATTPAVLGHIPLWLAVILHEGGTVLVGLNSLRLLKTKM